MYLCCYSCVVITLSCRYSAVHFVQRLSNVWGQKRFHLLLTLSKWQQAGITSSSEALTPGDTRTISEKPLDASRVSLGAAFGNVWEGWSLIDQTPSSPRWSVVFYNGCHYKSGFAHSLKAEGLFQNTLCEASTEDVRDDTWLSLVTRNSLLRGDTGLMTAVSSGWESCSSCFSTFHTLF